MSYSNSQILSIESLLLITHNLTASLSVSIRLYLIPFEQKSMLSKNDWDIHLNLILFSYRATMQSSTQYSPFHMMFGREPTFPVDTEHQLPLDEADQCEKLTNEEISVAMDSLHSFQKEMYSTAKENITKAQKSRKITMIQDTRHRLLQLVRRFLLRILLKSSEKGVN